MKEIIVNIMAILIMAIPLALLIVSIKLYGRTKKQETEIAILKERLKNFEGRT